MFGNWTCVPVPPLVMCSTNTSTFSRFTIIVSHVLEYISCLIFSSHVSLCVMLGVDRMEVVVSPDGGATRGKEMAGELWREAVLSFK
jgi:hypothetical protein